MYEVRPSKGCGGLGVFALRAIAAGERVICDVPLLHWHSPPTGQGARFSTKDLISQVRRLSPVESRTFYSLSQNASYGAEKTPSWS